MHLIVYTSEFNLDNSKADITLSNISSKAKDNNPETGITGLLFYHNQRFLQIIEGEKQSLEDLMSIIAKDKRHRNIERLIDQPIKKRGFNKWNMDAFNLDSSETLNIDELKTITAAFKANIEMDTGMLVTIYKTLLKSHALS